MIQPVLKTCFLSILLFIASALLTANVTLSAPLPQQIAFLAQTSANEPPIEDAQPVEIVNPQNSRVPEAGNVTQKDTSAPGETSNPQPAKAQSPSDATPKSDRSRSGGPYDMEAIKAFNRALYGS